MNICLIADTYPASDRSEASCRYITDLARGLVQAGEKVTVLRAQGSDLTDADLNVQVVTAGVSTRARQLQLAPSVSPQACAYMVKHLNYWHSLVETLQDQEFDVFETTQSLAGALLSAFSRECATVIRIENLTFGLDKNFDTEFQHLICRYAFSCVDAFSSPSAQCTAQFGARYAERIILNQEASAASAIEIYKAAQKGFAQVKKPNLYRHGSERMLKSAEDMLLLYDKMLYDLLFSRSYCFRLKHWLRSWAANPQEFAEKARAKLKL